MRIRLVVIEFSVYCYVSVIMTAHWWQCIVFGFSRLSLGVDVTAVSQTPSAHSSEMIHRAVQDVSVLTEAVTVDRHRMSGQR